VKENSRFRIQRNLSRYGHEDANERENKGEGRVRRRYTIERVGSEILRPTARLLTHPLTWSLVPRGTKAVRARLSPAASIWVVARQDVVAFGCCAPVASIYAQCFQGEARLVRLGVLQRQDACRRYIAALDGAAGALNPIRTVETHRLIAHTAFLLQSNHIVGQCIRGKVNIVAVEHICNLEATLSIRRCLYGLEYLRRMLRLDYYVRREMEDITGGATVVVEVSPLLSCP